MPGSISAVIRRFGNRENSRRLILASPANNPFCHSRESGNPFGLRKSGCVGYSEDAFIASTFDFLERVARKRVTLGS